ncbi:hypothetical protein I6F14_23635 [Bradyrhizobium sp. IC3069]|uniref:hypothetical protein n=1 Tax=unclassified Bradyrhizobium TaxID=2631580 RepID=UPI001CD44F8A|nr:MULTISPECIES: hypothetical protein [unclassified Bradyrhizobium]MCA1363399.1 hypothetical protein [Bradyrhizobium sp. IC4059]MCA1520937.1 hypothetical protein [Bradyrhizobium sp. IC3069]
MMTGLKRKQEQFCDLYPGQTPPDSEAALDIAIAEAMRERYHRGPGEQQPEDRAGWPGFKP